MRSRDRRPAHTVVRGVQGEGSSGAPASSRSVGQAAEHAGLQRKQATGSKVFVELAAQAEHAEREPIVLSFPGLKVKSPNRIRGLTRGAALSEAARRKRQRDIGRLTAQARVPPLSLTAPCLGILKANVTLVRVAPRFLDDDNYVSACKPLRDGVADAFGVADNHPHIQFWYEQIHGEPKEYAMRVEIRFEDPPPSIIR